jgi:phage replication-related protein YjqB (UPF0714/DUF867 family)
MTPFAQLLATPGVQEVCELRSTFGFMAFHGGNLEAVTDIVAASAAAQAGASYYGVLQPPGLTWHLPSHEVTPTSSDVLAAFLDHVDVAVAIHGYGRQGLWSTLLLGGRNRHLAQHVAGHLRRRLPAYRIEDDVEAIPSALRGLRPDNPVNLPSGGGVQIELPPRVRGTSPLWWDWEGPEPTPHTQALIDGLADAAASWDGHGLRRVMDQPPSPAGR